MYLEFTSSSNRDTSTFAMLSREDAFRDNDIAYDISYIDYSHTDNGLNVGDNNPWHAPLDILDIIILI